MINERTNELNDLIKIDIEEACKAFEEKLLNEIQHHPNKKNVEDKINKTKKELKR
jgi:hypothetical protein